MDPADGGFIEGPKNLALALVAYELAWVDGGAATSSLASNLGLSPIHEKGTAEQRSKYMRMAVPPQPGEDRQVKRGAFALTEPLPFVGVDTGVVSGKLRIDSWEDGQDPVFHVEKRGRFITNMGFANFVTAAVDSDDERIKGSCMVILEEDDPGLYDRGTPTQKLVHQLSSTRDPAFNLKITADRIIGGFTVKDGVIIPNFSHAEIIESVFRRTRVPVGIMSSAKLLSAPEPIIRYHRQRFRGGASTSPGTPRYDLGLQQKEDCLQRLVDIWAAGEAGSALGFFSARLFDDFDVIEKEKERIFAEQGIKGRAQLKVFRKVQVDALEYLKMKTRPVAEQDAARLQELENDTLVQFLITDSLANVFCPAGKLWNTGHGATILREAVSLMGGYGITEDCPGFLGQKWMDAQLEATYEGPDAKQQPAAGDSESDDEEGDEAEAKANGAEAKTSDDESEQREGEGDSDDDEDEDEYENALSLAAMEAELKPKVLETFDRIASNYKKLRKQQDKKIEQQVAGETGSRQQQRAYDKLRDEIVADVKSLSLNQNRIDSLVEQLYDINKRLVSNEGRLLRLAQDALELELESRESLEWSHQSSSCAVRSEGMARSSRRPIADSSPNLRFR